jgi:antitoxin component of MazEF toxin-antitoxin module
MAIDEEKLKELIEPKAKVEEISSISSDGRNLLTRIPKKIIEEAKIVKGQSIRWLVDNNELKIELIRENDTTDKKEKAN